MSRVTKIQIPCKHCNKLVDYSYYASVNVTLEPELRQKVFDTTIFQATCPHCGKTFTFLHPILYHDMDRKFMVQLERHVNLLSFGESIKNNPFKNIFNNKVIGVTSLGDLASAVIALERGYDWRICQLVFKTMEEEFYKYCKDKSLKVKGVMYTGLLENKEDDKLLLAIHAIINDQKQRYTAPFNVKLYAYYEQKYKPKLDELDPFIFNEETRDHYIEILNRSVSQKEKELHTYYFVSVKKNDPLLLCGAPDDMKLEKNDKVNIITHDGKAIPGVVEGSAQYSELTLDVPARHFATIADKYVAKERRN